MFSIRTLLTVALMFVGALVLSSCGSSKPEDVPTAEERFRLGMNEYEDDNWLDALQHFEVIRLQYPGSTVSDSARFFSGMSRFHREEFLLASYEFSQTIQNHPSSKLVPEAQFMYAECFYESSPKYSLDQTYTSRAIDALQTFIELFPNHPKAQEAEKQIIELNTKLAEKDFKIGILYTKMENYSSALIYFDGVIDKYYNTSFVDAAIVEKLRILIRRKQFAPAKTLIASFLKKYPDSTLREEVVSMQRSVDAALQSTGDAMTGEKK